MFRVVFLTFHGQRHVAAGSPAHPGQEEPAAHAAAPSSPAAGHHLHDAPRPMAIALVALAIGSVLAGYAGFPSALGGSGRFEHFLEPSFAAYAQPGSAETTGGAADHAALELELMALSSAVAIAGIGIAAFFFLRH